MTWSTDGDVSNTEYEHYGTGREREREREREGGMGEIVIVETQYE